MDLRELRGAAGSADDQRFIRRHRLQKKDPSAAISEPVKPITYYLDPGAPEPIRSALLDGARWWNQAFEAAGYRDAFRVELLPEGVSPLDIRYNVINWVHRSTRGWSTGGSVSDPRTGEIIKGVVTLGSLRIRQDYMIAEGLLSPYKDGTETPKELTEWGLARIRQLAAHEVGHTLGIGHNYYDSTAGRISVMDYPHPLVTHERRRHARLLEGLRRRHRRLGQGGHHLRLLGLPDGHRRSQVARARSSRTGTRRISWYLSNQDIDAHPRVDQWSNGTDATAELKRMMAIRKFALSRFGEQAIKRNEPMATIEEVLVPLYLHHRYQVEAAASTVGGIYFGYAMRGDGREPVKLGAGGRAARRARRAARRRSRRRSWRCRASSSAKIPPRPSGYGNTRELFPRYTGQMFDAITPAVVASDMTVGFLLDDARAARLVEQHALDPALPGLETVIDQLLSSTFGATSANAVRGRDRARRSARRRRAPDDARVNGRHAAGAGHREPEAPAARAAAGGRAADQRRRVRARGAAGVGHQAVPRSAVCPGERASTSRRRRRARRSAIRGWTGWGVWRRSAAGNVKARGSGLRPRVFESRDQGLLPLSCLSLISSARAPRTSRPGDPCTARSSRRPALPSGR